MNSKDLPKHNESEGGVRRKMGTCAKCGLHKTIAAHGLCEADYQQERRERERKAEKLTAGVALNCHSWLLWVLHTLDVSDRDVARIREILRPYFAPIAKVIQFDVGLYPETVDKTNIETESAPIEAALRQPCGDIPDVEERPLDGGVETPAGVDSPPTAAQLPIVEHDEVEATKDARNGEQDEKRLPLINLPPQQNLWVDSGSGSLPKL